ncbi:hypothetical protein LF1_53370 [Rubripirellula obstinata]|uniref:Uncharacterized protein n=2 Tax=Rubripirellula obstinata TaxID=406547 RepID=A0A5B1C8N1_9BACT|nr:hypothetical protein LF1_53370 [Rubripirellula obstinata]
MVITLETNASRYYVSWVQEDGVNDDRLFYWLSLRKTSHFNIGSLEAATTKGTEALSIPSFQVHSVQLFGERRTDTVYASLLQTNAFAIGIALIRWLPNKNRFSRFGTNDLAQLDGDVLLSCVEAQELELVADL